MKNLYSVYDSVNDEFGQPFMLNNDNSAKDMFIKDIKHIAKQNLQKFEELDISRYKLYCLCAFDECSGIISPDPYILDIPKLIYDVANDFDFSIFDEKIEENNQSRGIELKGDK